MILPYWGRSTEVIKRKLAIYLCTNPRGGAVLDKSSKIDRKMMEHICLLAKLNLTDAEKDSYARELSDVLEAFKVLDTIDAKDEPAFHPIEIRDRLREDEVIATKWDSLANARATDKRYIKGPKIV